MAANGVRGPAGPRELLRTRVFGKQEPLQHIVPHRRAHAQQTLGPMHDQCSRINPLAGTIAPATGSALPRPIKYVPHSRASWLGTACDAYCRRDWREIVEWPTGAIFFSNQC
jgi:hypothetical protein